MPRGRRARIVRIASSMGRRTAVNALIVYYSLSGTARAVATALAHELGADIEEIRCGRYSRGFWGFIHAAYESWKGDLPPIEPLSHAQSRYDLVVIGGPIWMYRPAPPVRAYLRQEAARLTRPAFFLTHGGSAGERSLREMELVAGRAPVATLVVREADVRQGKSGPAVSSFASALRTKFAA
jgi:hypothetical protein